ncbi:LysR substrate-binding domain-containing protein [Neptunicoccus cionae]|uniref:LysR substrate-binding domain-containing protein n=1 Tax=Neptunicoccus cionae TaxID=2035344 RepID=UPI000C763639|nr:LysR substrate-binding domain-containing protein [Amylibacter cionae]PLS22832.1 LysR family transcriptional regulator [Amylibacter cionae]
MDWRDIPSLAALRAFEATARHLNFSKAARELNVTHAAIAQHVRGLEAEFKEALVQRQGRGLALTPSGYALSVRLQTGFGEIAAGVDDLRRLHEDRPLNISVTPAFATNWLMPRIGSFWRDHPEITVNINPSVELVDLSQGVFDLAIRYGDGDWQGMEVEKLTDGGFCVVAHPDLVKEGEYKTLKDTQSLPWLLEESMMERRAMLEAEGLDFDNLNVNLMSRSSLALSGVMAGLGVTLHPRSLIEREVATGQLTLLFELESDDLGYYLVWLPSRDGPKERILRKWLLKVANGA